MLLVLVGERVGEDAHRVGAGDGEAIAVQEAVELGERQGAVPAQDGERHAAQPAAVDRDRIVDSWGKRRLAVGGRPASSLGRHHRVEQVAVGLELGDEGPPFDGQLVEGVVEVGQSGETGVALDLDADPLGAGQPRVLAHGDSPQVEVAGADGEAAGVEVHGGAPGATTCCAATGGRQRPDTILSTPSDTPAPVSLESTSNRG
ncbi:MAG TPA: hypothetical protein VK866_00745 [Acidimicrobiales bacterium]|nr:hypothetical protein [Acidimicrobiales bacterium]